MIEPSVVLRSPGGDRATVLTHGAHVVGWSGAGAERLYLSPTTGVGDGVAIRGGVPVVFPQFNQRGPDKGLPKHGFARNRPWNVTDIRPESATLKLADDAATRALWPHAFLLTMTVTLTDGAIDMVLSVENTGDADWAFTAALHTYLAVGDVEATAVTGLAGTRVLDTVVGHEGVAADAPLRFTDETDRIYWDATGPLTMRSPAGALRVTMAGFEDVVVWNPWQARAAALPDLPADDWRRMLCIEAAQIGRPVTLPPGATWRGAQTLTCG